jgi:hypothetical protein
MQNSLLSKRNRQYDSHVRSDPPCLFRSLRNFENIGKIAFSFPHHIHKPMFHRWRGVVCVFCGNVSWTRDMSQHSLGTHPCGPRWATTVLEVCISMNFQVLRPRFQKGQWLLNQSLPRGGIMTPGLHYGVLGTNAGEHSYGDGYSCLSCLPRVPIRCRKP